MRPATTRRALAALATVSFAFASACSREDAPRAPAGPPDVSDLERFFPDVSGPAGLSFVAAGPAARDGDTVRRVYVRGAMRVEVSMGRRLPGGRAALDRWVSDHVSQAQMDFHLSEYFVRGYFDCQQGGGADPPPCDGHIRMRSGFFIDVMGGGTTPRGPLQDIMAGLPIWALVESRGG